MYFLYSLGGVTFNKCWITLSILNCYSPNFQGFILMNDALNNQVGMLGGMFLWLVARGHLPHKTGLWQWDNAISVHIWTLTFFEIFSFQKFVISCKKMTMNGAISWDMVNPEEITWFRICPKAKILLNSQNHHSNQFANYF